ncbi:MAG: leucine-rich repeat domain-containing protein [Propionibacteriaceae bacterium]|jgi:Leucine-rich repeat (LRR) protein|nr:leucine-rich repeat domain-containing protein [Propionibacteriaceae bacterium]
MNTTSIHRKPVAVALAAAVALGLCLPAGSAAADPPVSGSAADPAAVVDIPDPNLRACLARILRLAPSAEITVHAGALRDEGLPTSTSFDLSCPSFGIRDLTGLDQLGIEWWMIDLADNDISDIGPIARLSQLPVHLDLSGNKIKDLSPLNGLSTSPAYIDLSYNEIEDIRPLAQLPYAGNWHSSLSDHMVGSDQIYRDGIHLDGNHISDITPLDRWIRWGIDWTAADQVIDRQVMCYIVDYIGEEHCGVIPYVATSVGEITWTTPGSGTFTSENWFDTGGSVEPTVLTWEAGTFTGTLLADLVPGLDYAPIRDAGLLRCLDVALGLPVPSLIPVGAVVGADSGVDCSGQSIRRLDGIDSLDWRVAQDLDLADNEIRDLVVPAYAPALLELDLSGNRIQDVAPLAGLSGLHTLDLAGNRVADIAPLAQLADLGAGHNHICYSEECVELWVRGSVNLNYNRISDLSPLGATQIGQGASGGTLSAVGQFADLGLVSAGTTVFPVVGVSGQPVAVTGGSSTTPAGGVTFAAPGGSVWIRWTAHMGDDPSGGAFSGSADVWVEGPETSLEDPALAECVGANVGLKAGATLTTDMTAARSSLDCSGRGISTLEGLASFAWQSLVALDLSDNDLVKIAGAKKPNGGDALTYADLSGNRITDPSPILQRENLVELDLSGNQIADLSAFSAVPSDRLRGLDLSGNLIADVAPLSGLTSLGKMIPHRCVSQGDVVDCRDTGGYLLLDDNRIIDLGPLDGLAALQATASDFYEVPIPSYSALGQRPASAKVKTGTFPLPVNAGQFGPVAVQVASGDAAIDAGQVTYRSAGPVVLTWTGEKFSGEVTQNVTQDDGGGGLARLLEILRSVIQRLLAIVVQFLTFGA